MMTTLDLLRNLASTAERLSRENVPLSPYELGTLAITLYAVAGRIERETPKVAAEVVEHA